MSRLKVARPAIIVALVVAATIIVSPYEAEAARAFFIFGDSIVDSGNNNYLATPARADSPPYGIDYPSHQPTGRFSNGLNFPDIICEAMELEPTLPYLNPELDGQKLLNGANFASAGIGILNDTGYQFVSILRMFRQFELFQEYQQRVGAMIGQAKARQLVNNGLVLISLGGNDFVNNYFLPTFSFRRQQFALPDYCQFLVSEYEKILMELYKLGARRVIVLGTGPLGCVPAELANFRSENGECSPEPQRAAAIYNPLLLKMLQALNTQIGSEVFIYANAFDMSIGLITKPQKFGFVTSKIACCGQGPYNGLGTCTTLSNLCKNRDGYVFWDPFHPSERTNRIIVQHLKTGSTKYINPMNLTTIMAMDANISNN